LQQIQHVRADRLEVQAGLQNDEGDESRQPVERAMRTNLRQANWPTPSLRAAEYMMKPLMTKKISTPACPTPYWLIGL